MNPILYIVAFTDVPDFNAGKMAAHCAHAASQADSRLRNNKLYKAWKRQASGFGTTIVLKGTSERGKTLLRLVATTPKKIQGGYVYDPTYPIKIPNRLIPLIGIHKSVGESEERKVGRNSTIIFQAQLTCAWFFGDKEDMPKGLLELPLR